MNAEKFPPVNCCIYCGASGERTKLGDEHIIAFGLGGNLILPRASCGACATETGGVEQHCLRSMLGAARIRMGMPTRNRGERPTTADVLVETVEGMTTKTVPLKDFPTLLQLPVFELPGLLIEKEPSDAFHNVKQWARRFDLDTNAQIEKIGGGGKFTVVSYQPWKFALMLAKIGHAAAVAACGLKNFSAFLPDVVLRKCQSLPYFVGSAELDETMSESGLHHVRVSWEDYSAGRRYLVTRLRLFANMGAPTYVVVAGIPLGPSQPATYSP